MSRYGYTDPKPQRSVWAVLGRILLKDFRDVRGDALFGKRTFLVRHGRARTCLFSGCAWAAGTCLILAASRGLTLSLLGAEVACTVAALALLRALSADRGPAGMRRSSPPSRSPGAA